MTVAWDAACPHAALSQSGATKHHIGAVSAAERLGARILIGALLLQFVIPRAQAQNVPAKIPRRNSTQLLDGFGVNVDLPRRPRMPWTKTWTPLFDAGVKWVRIGQYENSSESVNWDWVEQTPGRYAVPTDADEALRSLLDNGVAIEVELQYSNPLYAEDKSKRPEHVTLPPPGIGQNDDPVNPIFLAPKTDEQIEAFLGYVRFMVSRYKGRINHWELWNEENIGYWRPDIEKTEKARWYGRVLCRFADAVHATNPDAKVMFGGLADLDLEFAVNALKGCAEKIDIMAYHSYPGGPFGVGRPPEEIDLRYGGADFRQGVRSMPGIRPDLEFWLNEWNVNPKAEGSNQSVQARYLPRFYLEQLAHNIRGFIWVFMPGTDGNEDNRMGILEGDTQAPDAFRPREAFFVFQHLSAVFGQTVRDPIGEDVLKPVKEYAPGEIRAFWFRDLVSGRRVFAYWLAIPADPKDHLKPVMTEMTVADASITQPVLMDIRTGDVRELRWNDQAKRTVRVPLKDSVMAVADAKFLDWVETPQTPGELVAERSGEQVKLHWKPTRGALRFEVESSEDFKLWRRAGEVTAPLAEFSEKASDANRSTYRVRATNANGRSPWSNPAWPGQ
jgi:hypothetical protein